VKEKEFTRRDFLAAAAATTAVVVVKTDTPRETSKLAGKPGTRWIGHL
jgi:hypothetical protein